jgi:4-hydroxy-4-methyl-2-oxoglutarate aldolase
MTTRAMHLKAAGAVLDGYSRDTPEVLQPRACRSSATAATRRTRARVARSSTTAWRWRSTACASKPGDIVFGDLDGVLVIPRQAEEEAIRRALEKASTENKVRDAIAARHEHGRRLQDLRRDVRSRLSLSRPSSR